MQRKTFPVAVQTLASVLHATDVTALILLILATVTSAILGDLR